MLFDNAPGHPQHLNSLQTPLPVEIVFLPPTTTSLLQPMDQGVIANFKAYYLRRTFRLLFHAIDGPSQESISSFWKNFNIKKAVENIGEAWEDVTNISIKFAWRKVWPDVCHHFTGFEVQESITRDIVQLANQAGLTAVDINDVEELLASHGSSFRSWTSTARGKRPRTLQQRRLNRRNSSAPKT